MPSPTTRAAVPTETTEGEKPEQDGWSTTRFILTLAVLAWVVRSLIIAPFSIPSGSMLPTLYIGDYVAVAKWPYGYSRFSFPFGFPSLDGRVLGRSPSRGDVVVFRQPDDRTDLIKRVIGVPGDSVEVRGGALILNGRPVARRAIGALRCRSAPTPHAGSCRHPCRGSRRDPAGRTA